MIRWNVSKSNEAINREQAIANLRKLTRYCKWATICTAVALALGLLAVIAIYDLLILPSLSQGFCLQSVELEAGEGPILALVGADEHTPSYACRARRSYCHRERHDDMPCVCHRAKRIQVFLRH